MKKHPVDTGKVMAFLGSKNGRDILLCGALILVLLVGAIAASL